MGTATLLAALMVGPIQPTYRMIYVTPAGDTLIDMESADGLEVHVRVAVSRSGSTYVYTYTLTNDPASTQALDYFSLRQIGWKSLPESERFAFLDSVQSPPGWECPTLEPYFEVDTSLGTPPESTLPLIFPDPLTGETAWVPVPPEFWKPILRVIRDGYIRWSARMGGSVRPGDSLGGFRIFSRYPPDPVHWFVSGFQKLVGIGLWTQPPDELPDSVAWLQMALEDSMRLLTPYGDGKVYDGVGPGWPVPNWPEAYPHLQDRIQRVDSLGWFLDPALRDTLTARLDAAYAAFKRRRYREAYQHLSAAMDRLQQGRGSAIDDRGFYVLYYRFLEARERLPLPARVEKKAR